MPGCVILLRPEPSSPRGFRRETRSGDHGGNRDWGLGRSRGPTASEALLSAAGSLQPHGGSYAALVSERGGASRGARGGQNSRISPEKRSYWNGWEGLGYSWEDRWVTSFLCVVARALGGGGKIR